MPKQLPSQKNAKVKAQFESPLHLPKNPFETSNTYNKIYFERAYLGENVTKLLRQKVAQNVAISLGTSSFQKVTTGIQK